jgi:type II secretory pathway component GspD/PulD (secretin)
MKATTYILSTLSVLALAAQPFAQDAEAPAATNKPGQAGVDNAAPANASAPAAAPLNDTEKGLRLNFRGVSLDQVLNYMSEAAGFIINVVPGTDVKGKVDVWSNQPLNKEEAVQLLNTILHDHGLAAIRTGRTLSIINRNDAKTNKDVPVKKGNKPEEIERSDEMVTQIIPVKYANAAALVQNLQPLLPEYAQNGLSANESGNALILTATQTDVRRMTEIVSALDTAISSVSEIKVFALKYADAKDLAASIKELFTPPAQQQQQGQGGRGQFLQQMFGGGGGGPFGGGGPGGGGGAGGRGAAASGNAARGNTSATAARVVAVADERSNSLIVAAAQDAMPEIERLVNEVDVAVDDVTEIRVFPLMNSDPNDLADILSQLFPDPTTSSTANNQRFGNPRFGGGFGGFGGGGPGGFNRGAQTANTSERAKKQGRVVAVADARTASLIVTAARELMPQIEAMIKRLDASRARHQVVKVYTIENADVQQVEQVVRDMFDRSNNGRNNNNQNSALATRQQQNIQNQSTGMSSGLGGGTGAGGASGLGAAFGR